MEHEIKDRTDGYLDVPGNNKRRNSYDSTGHERVTSFSFVVEKENDGFSFAELVKVFIKSFPHPFMMVLLYA